ncbi:calcium-binding protein [Streptomyces sp. NPDC014733]|uniref:calcium-binding protein n=1 Tax=Streptomyces sp. NPDC014733 TaxID=3364885 RepID=UPI0036F6AD1E
MRSSLPGRPALRAAAALALVLTAGAAAPSAVAAAPQTTAAVAGNGRELTYTAAPGRADDVTVTETYDGDDRTRLAYLIDDRVPVTAGHGCTHPDASDATTVRCTVATVESQDPYAALTMDLGDRDDRVTLANTVGETYYFNRILLGDGDDTLTTSGPADGSTVVGGAGDDRITVGEAAGALGGEGRDTIEVNGDSAFAEGGPGDDVLKGGPGDQTLSGDDGDDRLYGGPGDDILNGGAGDDILYGNSGNDHLYGGPGNDTLSGGPGDDVVQQD